MKYFIFSFLLLLTIFSCADDEQTFPVGGDFIDPDVTITRIDTLSITSGTIKLDSVVTSGTGRILIGNVEQDFFGKTTAQPYMQLNLTNFNFEQDATYESLELILKYDGYIFGDTLQEQTYNVHRVTENIVPDLASGNLFNVSEFEFDPIPLGTKTFIPRPNSIEDSIFIKLDDSLGQNIFDMVEDDLINTSDDFIQFFNGITIVPDNTTNSHILGFNFSSIFAGNNSSVLRLNYNYPDEDNEIQNGVAEILVSSNSLQFNNINSDLSGTNLEPIANDSNATINSQDSNNRTFVQSGTGISTKINFPTIRKINEISNDGTVLNAFLNFKPGNNAFNELNPIRDSLNVFIIDEQNDLVRPLTDLSSSPIYALLRNRNDEFGEQEYQVNLSFFVDELLQSPIDLNYSLLIQFPDFTETVNHVFIENNNVDNKEIKLELNYLEY